MKNVKKLSLILALSLLASCLLGVSAFAGDKAVEKDYFEINTDILYAKIPDDFDFDPYGTMNFYDTYYFSDGDCNTLQFEVIENTIAPEGVRKLTNEQAIEIVEDYYGTPISYLVEKATVERIMINGISTLKIDGLFSWYPLNSKGFKEDNTVFGMRAYILATKENVFLIVFESFEEELNKYYDSYINGVISSLLINGTYFEGDSLTVTHDFSNAPAYDAAIADDVKKYDNEWGDSDYNDEIFDDESLGVFEEGFSVIMIIISIFTMILPTIIFIILAVVFGLKYNKNKKKLDEYEARYGFKGMNSFNNPNLAQPDNYGYNNQPYGAQGNGAKPYNSDFSFNNQAPVNMPAPPTQAPIPPQDPTVNSQTVSNLAPELQDSQADENK